MNFIVLTIFLAVTHNAAAAIDKYYADEGSNALIRCIVRIVKEINRHVSHSFI